MKVLGKNVVIATKKICVEYTSRISGEFNDCLVGSKDYLGENIKKDVIFVKDKKGYYVELEELKSFPTLSLICYGAARRWKTSPNRAGDEYIDNIKPYFAKLDQETLYDIKTLISTLNVYKTEEYQKTLSTN